MRAITFVDIETLDCGTVPDPTIRDPGDAIVEVAVAGLCGSDLHPYLGRERGLDAGTVMGHELVGRVLEVGADVNDVQPGDRVVAPFTTSCGGCFYCRTGLTSRCPARHLLPAALDHARRDPPALAGLISHRLPLTDGVAAYRRLAAREEGMAKVVLVP